MDNPPLTAQDRCDRCGVAAQARTMHDNGPLLWCAHHFRKHMVALSPLLVFMTPEIAKSKEAPVKR